MWSRYNHSLQINYTRYLIQGVCFLYIHALGSLSSLVGRALDHRSLPSDFKSRRGIPEECLLRLITIAGRSAHLAYRVHKSGGKTSIIFLYTHL